MYVQPNQINSAVLLWYLVKNYASVRFWTEANTEQVMFYKVQENRVMFNWSPCTSSCEILRSAARSLEDRTSSSNIIADTVDWRAYKARHFKPSYELWNILEVNTTQKTEEPTY